jgi:hypothetical protein
MQVNLGECFDGGRIPVCGHHGLPVQVNNKTKSK